MTTFGAAGLLLSQGYSSHILSHTNSINICVPLCLAYQAMKMWVNKAVTVSLLGNSLSNEGSNSNNNLHLSCRLAVCQCQMCHAHSNLRTALPLRESYHCAHFIAQKVETEKGSLLPSTTVYDSRNQASKALVLNFGLCCLWAHQPACEAVSGSVTGNALRSQTELQACLSLCECEWVCEQVPSQLWACPWLMM